MAKIEAVYGVLEPNMSFVDLHIHGIDDDGRLDIPRMVYTAVDRGLSGIGVTLHNNYPFGVRAYDFVERNNVLAKSGKPFKAFPGSEVPARRKDGTDAHVLVYEADVGPYQTIAATLEEAERKDGFTIIPHPDGDVEGAMSMDEILETGIPANIEVYNASTHHMFLLKRLNLLRKLRGEKLVDKNKIALQNYRDNQHRLGAATGGTDAHKFKLGLGMTGFKGDNLREALTQKRTVAVRRREFEIWYPRDLRIHDRKIEAMNEQNDLRYNGGLVEFPLTGTVFEEVG